MSRHARAARTSPPTSRSERPRAGEAIKEHNEPGKDLHLSTADHQTVGHQPWLEIRSARWLRFESAPTEGVNGNKYVGGRLGYEAGPINIGFAYGKTETGATTPDFKNYNIQFNYRFGFATLHTLYDVKEWNPRKTKDLSIGATVPVGPGALKVGYTRADRSGGPAGSGFSDADDSTRLGVGYVYDLSKRAAMYTTYGQVTNKGAARSSVLYTPPAAMLGGEKSSGLEFGIRHTF